MFDWLNSNAGAMQAASALANVLLVCILVGVTAWYAWQTQRMAKEMREQRMDAIRPVIDIHFPDPRTSLERLSEAIGEEESVVRDRYTVRLRNIGSGPAFDLRVGVSPESYGFEDMELIRLDPSQEVEQPLRAQGGPIPADPSDPPVFWTEYRDVFGNVWSSKRTFSPGAYPNQWGRLVITRG